MGARKPNGKKTPNSPPAEPERLPTLEELHAKHSFIATTPYLSERGHRLALVEQWIEARDNAANKETLP